MNTSKVIEKNIEEAYRQFISEDHYPNIVLMGATGSGKSTLINTIFNSRKVDTGVGGAVSNEFNMIKGNRKHPINLIDSRGWETCDDDKSFVNNFLNYVSKDLKPQGYNIHIIWYCISVAATKIQDIDLGILELLNNITEYNGKICVVLTKCDEDDHDGTTAKEITHIIKNNIPGLPCYQVSKEKELNNSDLEMNKLISWSISTIDDEEIQNMFIAAQNIDIEAKRKSVQKYIINYATGAALVGFIPIPFSDAVPLALIQLTMLCNISKLYGLDFFSGLTDSGIKAYVSQLGKFISQFLSKNVLAGLIKMVPGWGSIIGGTINASVATAITYALGISTSETYYRLYKQAINGKTVEVCDFISLLENESFKAMVAENIDKVLKGLVEGIKGVEQ